MAKKNGMENLLSVIHFALILLSIFLYRFFQELLIITSTYIVIMKTQKIDNARKDAAMCIAI